MNRILLFLVCVLPFFGSNAQTVNWIRTDTCNPPGGSNGLHVNNNFIYSRVKCNDPLVYSNGTYSVPSLAIVRMSVTGSFERSYGNFQWVEDYLGDSEGNLYAIGRDSLLDNTYYVVCKYDSTGNLLWHFPLGTSYGMHITDMQFLSDGVVFGGAWTYYAGPWTGSYTLFLAKMDFNGNIKFLHEFDNSNSGQIERIITTSSEIYFAGTFGSSLEFVDSTLMTITLTSHGKFLARYSAGGLLSSAAEVNSKVSPYSLIGDGSGNIFFGSRDTTALFLFKYTGTGMHISTELLAEAGNTSLVDKLQWDGHGNLYFSGGFRDSLKVNSSVVLQNPVYGSSKWYMIKRNAFGVNEWALNEGASYAHANYDVFESCDLIMYFHYYDSLDVFGSQYYSDGGSVMMRLNCGVVTSVEEAGHEKRKLIYPNPTTGMFRVSDVPERCTEIRIYDVLGTCVQTQQLSAGTGKSFDLSTCSKGVYFLRFISQDGETVERIILN